MRWIYRIIDLRYDYYYFSYAAKVFFLLFFVFCLGICAQFQAQTSVCAVYVMNYVRDMKPNLLMSIIQYYCL